MSPRSRPPRSHPSTSASFWKHSTEWMRQYRTNVYNCYNCYSDERERERERERRLHVHTKIRILRYKLTCVYEQLTNISVFIYITYWIRIYLLTNENVKLYLSLGQPVKNRISLKAMLTSSVPLHIQQVLYILWRIDYHEKLPLNEC